MTEKVQNLQNPIEIRISPELTLRQFTLADAPAIFALIDKNRARLTQPGVKAGEDYQTLEDVENSIRSPKNEHRLRFGIWKDDVYVGTINITPDEDNPKRAEIGYYLGSEFEGKGYMLKAVRALVSWAFQSRGVEEVYASVHRGNEKAQESAIVLIRSGFIESGSDNEETIYSLQWPSLRTL